MSSSMEMANDYITLGEYAKAEAILEEMAHKAVEYITWYMSLDDDRLALSYENSIRNFYILDEINKALEKINALNSNQTEEEMKSSTEMAEHYAQKFDELYEMFNLRIGRK